MVLGIEASHAAKPKRTGVEEYCYQTIQGLKQTIPANVQVILYTHQPLEGALAEMPSNWQVRVLRWPLPKLWTQLRLSWEFLVHGRPDVFFAPGQLIPFIIPKKTVVTVHDSAFLIFPKTYNILGRWYLRLMNWLIVRRAMTILTPSQFTKDELLRLYSGLLESKIVVTPLGYDAELYRPEAVDPARADLVKKKIGITKPFIMSLGRLEAKKNTASIVRAFDILKQKRDIQLVLVGSPGVGYAEVEEVIVQSSFSKDIMCPGFLSSEDTRDLLGAAQAFVFPSLYEGFGIPVLEAMAMGRPVVASAIPALQEVGGDVPVYLRPGDSNGFGEALEGILGNPDRARDLGRRGQSRAQLFSWKKTVAATARELVK
jgi:glycosyltransferase involved in cell wall biosynthesis